MAADPGVEAVVAAAERIRSTAGWLLATLGAAAGVVLVGADLSEMKDVTEAYNVRLAVVAVVVVAAATAYAIFRVARVLAPAQHFDKSGAASAVKDDPKLQAIVAADPALLQELAADVPGLFDEHQRRVEALNAAQEAYIHDPDNGTETPLRVAQARLQATEPVVAHLRALSLYELIRERFRSAVKATAFCSVAVILGVLLFTLSVYDRLGLLL